jgi:hypothetical protein
MVLLVRQLPPLCFTMQGTYHNVEQLANAQAPHCLIHEVLQILPPLLHLLILLLQERPCLTTLVRHAQTSAVAGI